MWNPTFSRYDYQPFGCAIFDDVLTDSWPGDYYLNDWTIHGKEFSGCQSLFHKYTRSASYKVASLFSRRHSKTSRSEDKAVSLLPGNQ